MNDHTLQVGDGLLLGGDTRLTVLAVEGDTVWLGITAPEGAWVVAPDGEAPRRAALTALPGSD
jgi:Global regulator protein family